MSKPVVVFPSIAAVLSCAVIAGIWMSVRPASAQGPGVTVIGGLTFTEVYSAAKTVPPGDVVSAAVYCPGKEWNAITGGYTMSGIDGLTVASAVKDFPQKLTEAPAWEVEVANPKAASGPVTFIAKVRCEKEDFKTVAG